MKLQGPSNRRSPGIAIKAAWGIAFGLTLLLQFHHDATAQEANAPDHLAVRQALQVLNPSWQKALQGLKDCGYDWFIKNGCQDESIKADFPFLRLSKDLDSQLSRARAAFQDQLKKPDSELSSFERYAKSMIRESVEICERQANETQTRDRLLREARERSMNANDPLPPLKGKLASLQSLTQQQADLLLVNPVLPGLSLEVNEFATPLMGLELLAARTRRNSPPGPAGPDSSAEVSQFIQAAKAFRAKVLKEALKDPWVRRSFLLLATRLAPENETLFRQLKEDQGLEFSGTEKQPLIKEIETLRRMKALKDSLLTGNTMSLSAASAQKIIGFEKDPRYTPPGWPMRTTETAEEKQTREKWGSRAKEENGKLTVEIVQRSPLTQGSFSKVHPGKTPSFAEYEKLSHESEIANPQASLPLATLLLGKYSKELAELNLRWRRIQKETVGELAQASTPDCSEMEGISIKMFADAQFESEFYGNPERLRYAEATFREAISNLKQALDRSMLSTESKPKLGKHLSDIKLMPLPPDPARTEKAYRAMNEGLAGIKQALKDEKSVPAGFASSLAQAAIGSSPYAEELTRGRNVMVNAAYVSDEHSAVLCCGMASRLAQENHGDLVRWVIAHELGHALDADLSPRIQAAWSAHSRGKMQEAKTCLKAMKPGNEAHRITEDWADLVAAESMTDVMAAAAERPDGAVRRMQFLQDLLGNACLLPGITLDKHSPGRERSAATLANPGIRRIYADFLDPADPTLKKQKDCAGLIWARPGAAK